MFRIVIFVFLFNNVLCQSESYLATLANIPEDGKLNFTELSQKYGYPTENHEVETEDGYILSLVHIPGNISKPVLLVHGVFDTSDGWIIRGNNSLAIILVIAGYDVWLLNLRGNRYSRKHKTLDPDKNSTFWEFSCHEYGYFDLPAGIDYVLNATGQTKLSLVAFSEGTTSTFVLTSSKPEYNDKIKIFIALAPIAFLSKTGPPLSVIIQLSPVIDFFLPKSLVEITGFYSLTKAILNVLCTQLAFGYDLCYQGGMSTISGADPLGIEREFFPIVVGHFPAGTSRKNLLHFAQIGLRGVFAQYDHGMSKNLQTYRSFTPPVYDLSKVKVKTVLVSGKNDIVSDLEDVETLKAKLSSVEEHIMLERDKYNHLDHLWAFDAYQIEYPVILRVLAKYN